MMGFRSLAAGLWLFHCLFVVCAIDREFPGNAYLKYVANEKPINSEEDILTLQFKTVEPSGLLFHTQMGGGSSGDYVTVELYSGSLRYSVRLGGSNVGKELLLGQDLNDGKPHTVEVVHKETVINVTLDHKTSQEKRGKITTNYKKLEVDVAIYVGGAPNFQSLQGVKADLYFVGCLTDVEFRIETVTPPREIQFLKEGVVESVKVDMKKGCLTVAFQPYTFSKSDSAFICTIDKKTDVTGSFKFRTYQKFGTLLKQGDEQNGFTIKFGGSGITLSLFVKGTATEVTLSTNVNEAKVDSGNWITIEFFVSATNIRLEGKNKLPVTKTPTEPVGNNFFHSDVTAGGFIGCMRDLKINNNDFKPVKGVDIVKNVEFDKCNITDLCVFVPCLNGATCTTDGKELTCNCPGTGYKGEVCQWAEYAENCEAHKRRLINLGGNPTNSKYTVDVDGPGPLVSVRLSCNMTANPAVTVIETDKAGGKIITTGDKGTPTQPYTEDIKYVPNLKTAKALARNSEACKQYIDFGCKGARLLNAGGKDKTGYWVASNGLFKYYWGGAPPSMESCACGVNKTCSDKSKMCNCDARDNVWRRDHGWLTSTSDLPVTQVVFSDVKEGEANFSVKALYCTGKTQNTATIIDADGVIKLDKWSPPSHGIISLLFKTPYAKGTILYNGDNTKDYFQLEIVNETSIRLNYNIGNGVEKIELSLGNDKKLNDREWHTVTVYHNMLQFGLKLDEEEKVKKNPVLLEKDLNMDDKLNIGTNPRDVTAGFVGCIRRLTINGELIDLEGLANSKEFSYVKGGCGAACDKDHCKLGSKCVDNYNVYKCDCSLTPFYGYFCSLDYGASFAEQESEITYTYPTPENVPGVDIVLGFKANSKDKCGGDLLKITSKGTQDFFLFSINSKKNLVFSFESTTSGDGEFEISPSKNDDFCDGNRHTFSFVRRNEKLNFTVDGKDTQEEKNDRLRNPFPRMEKIIVGKQGDTGFKGCLTGVKVTPFSFDKSHPTISPIKDYVYDGKTKNYKASGISGDSKEKCGEEPEVPENPPTPRDPGSSGGSVQSTNPYDPTSGRRTDDDNKTAIIVIVVLILVLLLVVLLIVIYWYWARHKGEYHTHEDDEELKSTDPYIDMTTTRKPMEEDVEKKKEWFI